MPGELPHETKEQPPIRAVSDPSVVDASTARSQQGMDPATGAGNGDPNSGDTSTAAAAPEFYDKG